MRKNATILFVMMFVGFGVLSMGQALGQTGGQGQGQTLSHAYESQVSYQKGLQAATVIDWPYPPDVVEATIKDFMARKGYKGSGSRGYTVYRNVRLDEGLVGGE